MKKYSLSVVSMIALAAIAVGCAPAGSKTKQFKSGAPKEVSVSNDQAGKAGSLSDNKRYKPVASVVTLTGPVAKDLFNKLAVQAVRNEGGYKRSGEAITCTQSVSDEAKAEYSCEIIVNEDGSAGQQEIKEEPTPVSDTTAPASSNEKMPEELCDPGVEN